MALTELTAAVLGVTHALEPDHVPGTSPLTSEYADSRLSALAGACFSLGHVALVVAWLGVAALLLGLSGLSTHSGSTSAVALPEVVLDFLQFEDFGLLFGGAAVTGVAFFALSRLLDRAPLTGDPLERRLKSSDRNVLIGGGIFGVGWGLSGICPGAAYVQCRWRSRTSSAGVHATGAD